MSIPEAGQPSEDSVDPNRTVGQIVLSEGVDRLQAVAGVVPRLIHLSLILFFLGLIDAILIINPFVALITIAPISISGFYYVYGVIASITNPRWPHQNRLSNGRLRLIRNPRLVLYSIIARGRAVWPGASETGQVLPTGPTVEIWEQVENLHRDFETWDQNRTREEIRNILKGCESRVSELERIGNEANGIDVIDWQISLLQDATDEVTDKLTRRLPDMLFDELRQSELIPIRKALDFPLFGSTPITPPFIFPAQQLQGLFSLGRGLRKMLDGPLLC